MPAGRDGRALLARRTGVAAAERELADAAEELADGATRGSATPPRSSASSPSAAAISSRARRRARGARSPRRRSSAPVERLSGGEAARLALAAILLSRFDVLLLDEPTNDLDFDGLERLERFVATTESALVVVSHDRAFLDRTVTRIAEIEDGRGRVREWAGGWTEYAAARDAARAGRTRGSRRRRSGAGSSRAAHRAAQPGARRRRHGRPPRHPCADDEGASGRAAARPQRAAREAVRALAAPARAPGGNPVGQPRRPPRRRRRRRGDFTLGPIDLDLVPGERLAVTGRNGSGKSTLLAMLLGELPLERGARELGRTTVIGTIGQERSRARRQRLLLDAFVAHTGLAAGRRAHAARQVRSRRRSRRAALVDAVAGRADARASRRAAGTERQPPPPRRADEPPRPRGRRAARGGPPRATTAPSSSSPTTAASSTRSSRRGSSQLG